MPMLSTTLDTASAAAPTASPTATARSARSASPGALTKCSSVTSAHWYKNTSNVSAKSSGTRRSQKSASAPSDPTLNTSCDMSYE